MASYLSIDRSIRRQRGFTLVELVTVIVLMGIVSLAGIEIIQYTTSAYQKMLGRQGSGASARVAIDQVSRELRNALPGSVRASGSCLEFIPIVTGGNYLDMPVETSATSFKSMPLNPGATTSGRVAVYPLSSASYDLSAGYLSSAATTEAPDGNNEITVSFSASHRFPSHSPGKRFFLVDQPVSYCVVGDNLFRYSNYGYNVTQPAIGDLPSALPDRALLVNGIGVTINPFTVVDASLQRNGIVRLDLPFTEEGETLMLSHEVQLRNVP